MILLLFVFDVVFLFGVDHPPGGSSQPAAFSSVDPFPIAETNIFFGFRGVKWAEMVENGLESSNLESKKKRSQKIHHKKIYFFVEHDRRFVRACLQARFFLGTPFNPIGPVSSQGPPMEGRGAGLAAISLFPTQIFQPSTLAMDPEIRPFF